MAEAHLISTDRGVFRLFAADELTDLPSGQVRVMNVHTGMCHDFASPEDALAWVKGESGASAPLPPVHPTPEELAEWEALERKIDAKYGLDGDPLADL